MSSTDILQPPSAGNTVLPQTTTRTVLMCSGHSRPVVHLSYSNIVDGTFWIISACKDGKPMIRNGETGDWVGTLEGHKGAVWWTRFDASAARAVTASADFTAKVWDAVNGNELYSFQHSHIVKTADFAQDERRIVTGGMEKTLKLFDLGAPSEPPFVFEGHTMPVRCVTWTSDNLIVSSGMDNTLRLWDIRVGKTVNNITTDHPITSIELSRFEDGKYLTVASGKRVSFYETQGMNVIKEKESLGDIESASLSGDGKSYATGGSDFWVRLMNFDTGDEIECHKGHHGPVHTIEFAPNGHSYASGSEDGTIRIWPYTSITATS